MFVFYSLAYPTASGGEYARCSIQREKRLKKWKRNWKIELIESMNPDWHDLYDELL